jgi:hypothetical protein
VNTEYRQINCDAPFTFGDVTLPDVRCQRQEGHATAWHFHADKKGKVEWRESR